MCPATTTVITKYQALDPRCPLQSYCLLASIRTNKTKLQTRVYTHLALSLGLCLELGLSWGLLNLLTALILLVRPHVQPWESYTLFWSLTPWKRAISIKDQIQHQASGRIVGRVQGTKFAASPLNNRHKWPTFKFSGLFKKYGYQLIT